jgi:regulator of protease activity HflC (stomatin/prohibitin superfamily)
MNFEILLTITTAVIAGIIVKSIARSFRHVFCVPEGWTGLVYHHGLYIRRNNAGRDIVWGRAWTIKLIDLRQASLPVAGQEVLTSDHVSLKFSLIVTYNFADPVKAAHETQNPLGDIYHAAQLALRGVVNAMPIETLLQQRTKIGAQILARVQPDLAKVGINILGVEVKDVILPTELKRAFTRAFKAKLDQANENKN